MVSLGWVGPNPRFANGLRILPNPSAAHGSGNVACTLAPSQTKPRRGGVEPPMTAQRPPQAETTTDTAEVVVPQPHAPAPPTCLKSNKQTTLASKPKKMRAENKTNQYEVCTKRII